MLVIPIWAAENSYIPSTWVVSYSILGLFILEDWQIDLHPQTSSCPSCSVILPRYSSHGWLMETLLTSLIWTPSSWRGRSIRSVSQQLWGTLSSIPSSTSTQMLRMSVLPLIPMITYFIISHLCFRSIFLQALHSTHWCCMLLQGSGWSSLFLGGHHGPLGLLLFSAMAVVMVQWPSWTVLTIIFIWDSIPSQLTELPKQNPTSLVSPRGSPSLNNHHPKNKITTSSVICSSSSSMNMSAIYKPVHAREGWGWSPPPSPKVTLTWTQ